LAQALAWAAELGLERLDAQLLLLHALNRPHDRAWLIAHDRDELPSDGRHRFESLCARRQAGEPVAYLCGHKEFFGLTLAVDERVLVPRPETETLVDWALSLPLPPAARVIDLGTGSGAIEMSVRRALVPSMITMIARVMNSPSTKATTAMPVAWRTALTGPLFKPG
jgi:release factor glutamine methyltransferase